MRSTSYKKSFLFLFQSSVKMFPVALSLGGVPFRSLLFFLLPFFLLQSIALPSCQRSTEPPLGAVLQVSGDRAPREDWDTFAFFLWHLENYHKTDQICSAPCCHSWDRPILRLVNPRSDQCWIPKRASSLRSWGEGYPKGQSPLLPERPLRGFGCVWVLDGEELSGVCSSNKYLWSCYTFRQLIPTSRANRCLLGWVLRNPPIPKKKPGYGSQQRKFNFLPMIVKRSVN